MKKLFFLSLMLVVMQSLQAQKGINYQALIRNQEGTVLINQDIRLRFSLLSGGAGGNVAYSEYHDVSTTGQGMINCVLGQGVAISGNFSTIDWSSSDQYLKVELDDNGDGVFSEIGVSELQAVPYALYAENVRNAFSGNYNDLSNKPQLFDGQYSSLIGTPIIPTDVSSMTDNNHLFFSRNYNDLTNKPVLFDGQYSSLSGKPTIPADINQLSDNNHLLFSGDYNDLTNKPSNSSQTLSLTNDTIGISDGNTVKIPGTIVKYLHIPNTYKDSIVCPTGYDYVKLGDLGTFTKQSSKTLIELTMNTLTMVNSTQNSSFLWYQIRIDNQPTTVEYMEFLASVLDAGNFIPVHCTGIFKDLSAGVHTISVWVITTHTPGKAYGVLLNPGGFYKASKFIVKEYYGTVQN